MAAPAEDGLVRIVTRWAFVFALSVTVALPSAYFGLQYSNRVQHVEVTAQLKAQSLTALVAANPVLWIYQLQFVEDLLLRHPPQLADDRAIIRDAAEKPLVTTGPLPAAPVLVRSAPVYDSGRVVGQVEIAHSYREVLFGTLFTGLLGLLLGLVVYYILRVLPLGALQRVTAALVQETAERSAVASRYRAVAETANDAIITADSTGRIVGWNSAAERMFGYTETEAVGKPVTLMMPRRYRDRYVDSMRQILAGGARHIMGRSVEVHGLTKAGREFPVEIALSEWGTSDGRFFAGILRDITERRQAALALARQRDLYQALSQSNRALVRLADPDELFASVCRIAVEHGRFRFAWIGLMDENDKQLKSVARYGEDSGYIDALAVARDSESDARRGLTTRTLIGGIHVISNDFLNDPATAPWHEAAQRVGVRASAKFPIRRAGVVIGAISVYAAESGFFTEDVVATLDEIANDVSFGLDNYAREAARRKAEVTLREGEERYRQMFQANPHPMWVYDLETLQFLEVNDAAMQHYGWSREDFLAMTIADIRPPEDVPRLLENVARVDEKKVDEAGVWRHRKKDGALIDVEITSHGLDFGGRRAEIVLAHDITKRKQAEGALRAAEEQFRGLVEQSITGIYIIQESAVAYVNPRLAEILGYDATDELTGRDPLSLVAEKDRGTVAENIRQRTEAKAPGIAFSFTALRKDGSTVEIGAHSSHATYRGRPAIIGLMQDISEKKHAEEQIQHYIHQLENTFMRVVGVATTLSEMRDPYTAGHERRVGEIAAAIGTELGFDERRVEGLRVAGYLHDLGKISVPTEILAKPGKLSPTEFALIKEHAQASYNLLKNVEFPWPVAQIALQHHERLDGKGYPQGLKGEEILLEARIIGVADVIEAMSSHRPYRPGLGIDKALAEIERGGGTAYDPDVANACLRLFREKGYVIPA